MNKQTAFSKIISFFLTRIIIGIAVIVGSVILVEWFGRSQLDETHLSDNSKNLIIAFLESLIALLCYYFLFRIIEKRKIIELSLSSFWKNALAGLLIGSGLQSLFILVIYLAGGYSVIHVNAMSFLLPSFATAFTAGFVAEIIIRGIFFRITEEKLGTVVTLIILTLFFAIIHMNVKGANLLSISSTAVESGLLLSATYVATRSLWLPIFLHFAWDFIEPGIFGAYNPGNKIYQSLFTSNVSGSPVLTGGELGPQNSIQALIFCTITACLFLWIAKRKNNFIKAYWKK